jgi:hypothetical protein
LAECCPFLSRCEFCDKIVEVHELNEHHLKRCPFLGDTLVDCYMCGLARYPDEPEAHPKCRCNWNIQGKNKFFSMQFNELLKSPIHPPIPLGALCVRP